MSDAVAWPDRIEVVDSHTEGEPTRVVVEGWPPPEGRTMAERRAFLSARQDRLRQAVVCEPRGHDAVVGALLTPPVEPGSAAGVVFFNNAGALGMCGHGLIGVVRTLAFLGRLGPGAVRLDTPVGTVGAELEPDGAVTIENVPAFCHARDVEVEVPGLGRVTGDVAWGGNWFFLTELPDPSARPRERRRPHRRRRRASWTPCARSGSPAATEPRSTTSSSSARPAVPTPTRATSSSAPASRTTARRAGPARPPRWPSSPRGEGSRRASAGDRRASPARSSRAGSRRGAERSCPASGAARS